MNPAGSNFRNAWIDVLRGLAALSVVMFHFNSVPTAGMTSSWPVFWGQGYYGVHMFFAISGYCITASWLRSADWRAFARRRVRRILPPYFASLLVVLAVVGATRWFLGANSVTPLPRSIPAVLATLTLTTTPVTAVPTMNWVYWSLSFEVAFYALMTLCLTAAAATRVRTLAILHAVLCVLATLPLSRGTGPLFFLGLWPVFGMGLALAVRDRSPTLGTSLLLVSMLWGVAYVATGGNPGIPIVGLVTTALLSLAHQAPFPRSFNPLRWIGHRSYSLYLIHVPLGVFGVLRLVQGIPSSGVNTILLQLGAAAAVVGLAAVFFRFAERPFLNQSRPVA